MAGHTPGPWERSARGRGNDIFARDTFRLGPLATVFTRNDAREQEANARLISAAPDLLEACKELFDHMSPVDGRGMFEFKPGYSAALIKMANAIPKAEGRDRS